MLGHVYVVEDAKDLAQIVRDVTRYGGAYRPEVILSICYTDFCPDCDTGYLRVYPKASRLEENRENGRQNDVQFEFQGRLHHLLIRSRCQWAK